MSIDRTVELFHTLAPSIQHQALQMLVAAREAGIPLVLVSARRSPAGNRDVGGAARSLHLDGLAFDVGVMGYTRDQVPYWWWEALGLWAEGNLGLFWGGRFVHQGAPDVNHFDARRFVIQT